MPNHRKILLIDYDPKSIRTTREQLEKAGYTVEVASDGVSGLKAFERMKPDLVLIEPMVPKKHGFQVCQEIKATQVGQRTPVLITTAFYRGRKHRSEAQRSYGCDDYLEKPIAEDLLLSTCRRFLIDTQKPPIPLEPAVDDTPVELDLAPPDDEPQARKPDPPARELTALDDLSDDEIQARLDALISEATNEAVDSIEGPQAPEARPPEPVLEHDFGLDDADPALAAPEGEIDEPELTAEPEALPEVVFEAADTPAIDSSESEPFDLPSIPPLELEIQPPAEAVGEGAAADAPAESDREAQTEQDAEPPLAIEGLAPLETETTQSEPPPLAAEPDSEPLADLPTHEQPAKSRLPLWIGVAAAACLVAGAGLLFLLPGEGDPEPIEVARPTDPSRPAVPAPAGSEPAFPNPIWESYGSDSASPGEPASAADDQAPVETIADSFPPSVEPAPSGASPPTRPAPRPTQARPPAAPARREDPPPVAATEKPSHEPAAARATASLPVAASREDRADPGSRSSPRPVERQTSASQTVDSGGSSDPGRVGSPARTTETAEPVTAEEPSGAPAEKAPALDTSQDTVERVSDPPAAVVPVVTPSPSPPTVPEPASVPLPQTPEPPKARRGDLVAASEVDQAPVPRDKAAPAYPASARSLRQEGTFVLRLLVDEKGAVAEVEVVSGSKSKVLQSAATRAAKRWVYEPAVKDDVPVKVWITEVVTFKL